MAEHDTYHQVPAGPSRRTFLKRLGQGALAGAGVAMLDEARPYLFARPGLVLAPAAAVVVVPPQR